MCVIALSKENKGVPTKEDFKNMWDKNPHGAGIMVDLGGGKVEYVKGLMTFDAFIDAFDEMSKKHDLVKLASAFHFRIKTHGNTDGPTTHPFLLSPRYQDLRKSEYSGNTPVMMHNGTMPGFGGWLDKASSDTQDFAASVGYRMLRKTKKGLRPSSIIRKAVEKLTGGSRVVVFYGDGNPLTIGAWTEHGEFSTSNSSWKPYASTTSTSTTATSSYHGGTQSRSNGFHGPSSLSSPDKYGMKKDTFPSSISPWIKFSSKDKMDYYMANYVKVTNSDGNFYESRYEANKTVGKLLYKVDGTEVVTVEGMIMKKAKEASLALESKFPEFEDLDGNDYINLEDPEEFFEVIGTMEWDRNMGTHKNVEGDHIYTDYVSQECYSEKALKAAFKENWRYARQDILVNGTMNYDWTSATTEEKQKFTKSIAELKKTRSLKPTEQDAERKLLQAVV